MAAPAPLKVLDAPEAGPRVNAGLLEQMLDAAESCFDRFGFSRTTMEQVAQVSGLSRGLIYKYLGNRNGLLLAVLERRARLFNRRAKTFIEAQPTLEDALVEGILLAVGLAHRDRYFGLLVGPAAMGGEARIPGAIESARRLTDELWRPVLEAADRRGELAAGVVVADVIDWVMHLEMTLLNARETFGATDTDQSRQLRTLFAPAVVARTSRRPKERS